MSGGDLVHGDAGTCLRAPLPRTDAVQPRFLDDAVRAGALPSLVAQATDDRHVLAERLERLEDEGEVEIATGSGRLPFVLERTVREVYEAQTRTHRGGLRERRSCRDHCVQQRERDGRAGPLEDGSP